MRVLRTVVALLLILPLFAAAREERLRMDVYVYDPCGGCGTPGGCKSCSLIDEIANRYRLMFAGESPEIVFYNLRLDKGYQADCDERLEARGINPDAVSLPLVWIGDVVFQADGRMDEAIYAYVDGGCSEDPGVDALLREKVAYEARTEVGTVVYLYSSYCADCEDISSWLRFSLPPGYELAAYDIYTEKGQKMEQYLIESLDVPPEDYVIPFIAYGPYWFAGKSAIYLSLKSRIQEHPALSTALLSEVE